MPIKLLLALRNMCSTALTGVKWHFGPVAKMPHPQHTHDYDEYMVVVQGCYTLIINGERIPMTAGEEYLIPRGLRHSGEGLAGTRTIHAFGGPQGRADLTLNAGLWLGIVGLFGETRNILSEHAGSNRVALANSLPRPRRLLAAVV